MISVYSPNSSPILLLYTAHRHHKKAAQGNIGIINEPVLGRDISAAIYGKELFSLFLIIIRINRSHADIDHGSHIPAYSQSMSRIPPSGRKRKLSQTLSMWQRVFCGPDGPDALKACSCGRAHDRNPQKDFFISLTDGLIKVDPLSHIEGMIHLDPGIMEAMDQLHTPGHVLPAPGISIPRAFIKLRDLITCVAAHVDHMLRDPQGLDGVINGFFLGPVDEKIGSRPRIRQIYDRSLALKRNDLLVMPVFGISDRSPRIPGYGGLLPPAPWPHCWNCSGTFHRIPAAPPGSRTHTPGFPADG